MTRGWSVALALLLGASCTKSNPAATCADGTCSDPAFPFCDVDGEITGAAGTCVAVTCDAGSIGGCQGSDELVCSANGDTYVTKACANGCDPIAGCLECAPNQSVCTTDGNFQSCDATGSATTVVCPHVCDASVGCLDCQPSSVTCTADGSAVQTCDGSGSVASTTACTVGCGSDGGAHCAQLVPSNGLQTYIDMVPNPVDITLANGEISLGSNSAEFFLNAGGQPTTLDAFLMAAPPGGVPVFVLVGRKITLDNVLIGNSDPTVSGGLGPAIAFVATDDLDVTGSVTAVTGAISIVGCDGGIQAVDSSGAEPTFSGGGGGGNGTDGATGGNVVPSLPGGTHGAAAGSDDLVPLRGGCPGGPQFVGAFGGHGGGAVQLVSLTAIEISAPVVVDGNGNFNGTFGGPGGHGNGGGAGGGLLLEAPAITVDADGALLARGGGGFAGNGSGGKPSADGSPFPAGTCGSGQNAFCSNGGEGGTTTVQPAPGGNITLSATTNEIIAGGGGGAVGRIRINTRGGTFTQQTGAIVAGHLTTGVAATK